MVYEHARTIVSVGEMTRAVVVAAAAILLTGWWSMGLFSKFQRQMIFPGPQGIDARLLHQAAEQVGATELQIQTDDGETLYGWHRSAVRSGPRRVVIYFHGNASSVLAQVELQNLLLSEGWDFVGIHYRGYPGSTGVPGEAGLHEDANAAWRFVIEELDASASRVALHGRSLGGGVAVALAARKAPGALVLESTFTSIVDLAKEQFPWLPVGPLLEHRFESRRFADQVSCSVMVAHGGADSLIDVHHGKELARVFRAKQYLEAPGVDHNDPIFVGANAVRYLRFLDAAVPAYER